MIVTLTPNPSLDRTVEVDAARPRWRHPRTRWPGRCRRQGRQRLPRAGRQRRSDDGRPAQRRRRGPAAHLAAAAAGRRGRRWCPIAGVVRANVTVVEPDGTTTKLNEPGPCCPRPRSAALVAATLELAAPDGWVVGCGSLPRGVGGGLLRALVAAVRDRGSRVAVDTSRAGAAAAVAAGPDLVKPNREELAEATGPSSSPSATWSTPPSKLRAPRRRRPCWPASGSTAPCSSTPAVPCRRGARSDAPRSTVGAGDAMLAGYLSPPRRRAAGRSPARSPGVPPPPACRAAGCPGPKTLDRASR